jgi:Protein of unknown function (DUF3892)
VVQVTHIRLQSNSSGHEHIIEVRWYSPADGQMGSNSVASMVKFIREKNRAYVCDGRCIVEVGVVNATPPHIRTYADKVWTDNLLALPRF